VNPNAFVTNEVRMVFFDLEVVDRRERSLGFRPFENGVFPRAQ
jgi:hypothetical protein